MARTLLWALEYSCMSVALLYAGFWSENCAVFQLLAWCLRLNNINTTIGIIGEISGREFPTSDEV